MNIIGHVKDKKVIVLDDMIDTAGRLSRPPGRFVRRGY